MSGFYDEDIAGALEDIQDAGVQCRWYKGAEAPADPDKPWLGGGAQADPKTPYLCFVPDYEARAGFGLTTLSQGDVPEASEYALMGAQDFEPEVTDKVLRGAETLTVVSVDTLKPAGYAVLHVLGLR